MLTSRSARALRAVLLLVLACALLGLPTLATAAAPGHADRDAPAATADALERAVTGKVRGAITGSQQGTPKALMSWFSDDWRFLGKRKVDNGLYSSRCRSAPTTCSSPTAGPPTTSPSTPRSTLRSGSSAPPRSATFTSSGARRSPAP